MFHAPRILLLATSALLLEGCSISRSSYLSPQIDTTDAHYTYDHDAPVALSQAPEGVEFEASGLRFAVGRPECGKSISGMVIPPLPAYISTDHPTGTFSVKLAIQGDGVTYDYKQTLLRTSFGSWVQPSSSNPAGGEALSGVDDYLVFDTLCSVDDTYDLHIDGVKKGGTIVQVPPIHFARGGSTTMGSL